MDITIPQLVLLCIFSLMGLVLIIACICSCCGCLLCPQPDENDLLLKDEIDIMLKEAHETDYLDPTTEVPF